ncbi:hypothetical protein DUT91_24840, partial [Phyllobacterium salinisoli]
TTPVTAAGTKPATGNYSAWQVNVADINSTPVAGVDVFWRVSPTDFGLTFWDPAKGTGTGAAQLPTVQAGDNIFYAFSTSVTGGAASAWVMSERPYALTAVPRVNNADMGFVDTLFFASADYGGDSLNDLGWGELIPFGIQSYKYGTYVQLSPTQTDLPVSLLNGWPNNDPNLSQDATYFFVLNNQVGSQYGFMPITQDPRLSVNYLKSSIKDLETVPPSSSENFLGFFVQNPDGTLFGSKFARKFYTYIQPAAVNIPPDQPGDGKRDQDLPQAVILYLSNGVITNDTLTQGNGLSVQLKKLAATVYGGRPVTFLFYMNGYDMSHDVHEGPSNPDYVVTVTIPSSGGSTLAKLATEYATGFSAYQGHMKVSYIDYYIELTPGVKTYGPIPTAQAPTNT